MHAFLYSLISGVAIGGSAGYLGTLMLSRRMALVAGPLGHLTLPGIALALVWGFDVSVGAFPFVILGVFLIWLLEMKTKLPMEALTALVFAAGVAIAFLFLPMDQAETALVGDISKAEAGGTLLAVVASLLIVLLLRRSYSRLVLGNISEELAAAEGFNTRRYNLLYLFLIAVIVALGVKMVGGLLTAALVAIPPVRGTQPQQEPAALHPVVSRHRRRLGGAWHRPGPQRGIPGRTAGHHCQHDGLSVHASVC